MEAPERGALTLVRLIAVLLVIASIMELGLYWAECRNPKHPAPVARVHVGLLLIPAALGFIGLIRARALAAWVSDKLDL